MSRIKQVYTVLYSIRSTVKQRKNYVNQNIGSEINQMTNYINLIKNLIKFSLPGTKFLVHSHLQKFNKHIKI